MSNPDKAYLLEEWDYEENNNLSITPETVAFKSNKKVFWKCKKCGYKWQSVIGSRSNGINCPACAGQKVNLGFNDFKTTTNFTYLLEEWDYKKNNKIGITPENITAGSKKKVNWICRKCGHSWEATVNSRNDGHGCPECSQQGTSYPELALFYYLSKIYPNILHRHKINGIEFDVFVPSLNLAIEYDSSYYHKNKLNKENKKDKFCKDNNIRFIRLRDLNLPKTDFAEIIWFNDNSDKNISKGIISLFEYL